MNSEKTKTFKLSNGLCTFSPNGLYIAVGNHQRLNIYSAVDSVMLQSFACSDPIQNLEWSADSELIMTSYRSKGRLEVWCVRQPDWRCRISLGQEGMCSAFFAPGSRHVVTICELHLRLTIWSLVDRTVRHINCPKDGTPGVDFSPGGSLMAVIERRGGKDVVGVYSCESWCPVSLIRPELTEISGIQWSPDSAKLALWTELYPCKTLVYSASGKLVAALEAKSSSCVKQAIWAPTSQLLAVQTSKNSVQLFNHITWGLISTLSTSSKIYEPDCIVYEESRGNQEYEVVLSRPALVPVSKDSAALSRKKILLSAFSSNSRYLALLDEANPRVVWIWEIPTLSLKSVLVQKDPIQCLKWGPTDSRLALCCGSPVIYFWTPLGCAVMHLKGKDVTSTRNSTEPYFAIENLEWNVSGNALLLAGKESACLHLFALKE